VYPPCVGRPPLGKPLLHAVVWLQCVTIASCNRLPDRGIKRFMHSLDHILIVDDDREIRDLLREYLEKNGYRATAVPDGRTMWAALERSRIDLVVLDLMLPGDDGLVLCRTLRARSEVPIVMLTARGEETDRIVGLEMGADDYLPKPFSPRELLARIKVILRRSRALPPAAQPDGARSLRFAGWTLDTLARHLLSPEGVVVPLSGAEYRLLRVLLAHANRVLSRDQLLDLTQGRDALPFDRSIDVQVSRLRRHLGEDAREPAILKTVRGEGYVLAAAVEAVDGQREERR
jgi:two-component system, OmpR family, response regulator